MPEFVYIAVALGVFGTLTVDDVVESGGTALAVAAQPVLGVGLVVILLVSLLLDLGWKRARDSRPVA